MIHSCLVSCTLVVNTNSCFGSVAMFADSLCLLSGHSLFQCPSPQIKQLVLFLSNLCLDLDLPLPLDFPL
ncbi:hypothetical protein YC2023_082775 [Brassica napus]